MSLSLDAIFRPFNDFFCQKFAPDSGGPVEFRFAHLARTFVDSDFLNPQHPEWGPSPAMAAELFSAVVDGITQLDADGRTVRLSTSSQISDLYHDEILQPAFPFVPGTVTNDTEKAAIIDGFNSAKADALGIWEDIKATSLQGAGFIRLSKAMPVKWWDKTDKDAWTPTSFVVKGAATSVAPGAAPDPILRVKATDATKTAIVKSYLARPIFQRQVGLSALAGKQAVDFAAPMMMARKGVFTESATLTAVQTSPEVIAPIQSEAIPRISAMPFRERIYLQTQLADQSESRPLVTSDVTINFSYCLVNVDRAWLHSAFINNKFWMLPGLGKGQLSANDGRGVPALPVGFVAIKDLSIKAPWTPEDISNLEQSVQFGPFNFDSTVVDGAIGHDGIQIIGWLLQRLSDLPPNGTS
jgi:hypothetical protein